MKDKTPCTAARPSGDFLVQKTTFAIDWKGRLRILAGWRPTVQTKSPVTVDEQHYVTAGKALVEIWDTAPVWWKWLTGWIKKPVSGAGEVVTARAE